ncbi:DUF2933 domain-containing protein [Burkholderia cepacia]|nr:DUF2933 domain-containing protein [Burkholderia cepacia]
MLFIALTLTLVVAIGYWALPQFRGMISTLAVVACAFVCPVTMIFMMRSMPTDSDPAGVAHQAADETRS